ncbi:MAG: hypothetical protein PHS34_08425 [Candidatus Omnitrophica bacterium]|nr:hypothetical protein [Candidatus Nanoarchaeia archaeon]MDD5551270.1 hypothetical protein [Candidatus Omnitrophota bacterium]
MAKIVNYHIHTCWGTPIICLHTKKRYISLGAKRTRELFERVLDREIIGKKLVLLKERGRTYGKIGGD